MTNNDILAIRGLLSDPQRINPLGHWGFTPVYPDGLYNGVLELKRFYTNRNCPPSVERESSLPKYTPLPPLLLRARTPRCARRCSPPKLPPLPTLRGSLPTVLPHPTFFVLARLAALVVARNTSLYCI